jgi:protein-tyrosine phosphatase
MSGRVDIHTHVLPGIDDGPGDLFGALEMARAAARVGTTTMVATPHLRSDFPAVQVEELAGRCQSLREELKRAGIEIRLESGAEASLLWALEASDAVLELATYQQRGSDLLVEAPTGGVVGLDTLLFELRRKGIRVTLAHPERSMEFQRDYVQIAKLVRQGVLIQVNADSLVNEGRRSPVRRLAEALCREGLAHALASDGHRAAQWRPVGTLADAVEGLSGLVGASRVEWMTEAVPASIVEGTELPAAPAIAQPGRGRRRWLLGGD